MGYVRPPDCSRAELDRVGDRFRNGSETSADAEVLDAWRASHLYVINTFQAWLRSRRRLISDGSNITIAQRLKRHPTIVDKLQRQSGMHLSRMHDIAGCRLIFPDIRTLNNFRQAILGGRVRHEHVGSTDKYDYIRHPKNSGYRGIHDVYRYNVKSTSGTDWNGLRIELQYRTYVQHSWATAVEISDIVNRTRLKFSEAGQRVSRLFVLCSEVLARAFESSTGNCPGLSNAQVLRELKSLEASTHAIQKLRNIASSDVHFAAKSHKLFVLVNFFADPNATSTQIFPMADTRSAARRYSELEREHGEVADVVLVGASEQDAVKLAYTNYFSDASTFLGFIDDGIERLARR